MGTTTTGVRSLEVQRYSGNIKPATQAVIQSRVLELAEDQGGLKRLSARELSLLRDAALCDLIIERAVEALDAADTLFVETAEGLAFLPVLRGLATFMNTKRLHFVKLGLRPKREKRIRNPHAAMARKRRTPVPEAPVAELDVTEAPVAEPTVTELAGAEAGEPS
jgi:hypothetical protein